MEQIEAIKVLSVFDRQGRFVYRNQDFKKMFPSDSERACHAGLVRLEQSGILKRAVKGIYVFALSQHINAFVLEHIAKVMRRGEYTYVSLESALSEYGVISQIPIDRLTLMTTGRKGEYKTPFGVIEFIHTKRSVSELIESMLNVGRPLRLAQKHIAYRDLKRVGRNVHLVDKEAFNEN